MRIWRLLALLALAGGVSACATLPAAPPPVAVAAPKLAAPAPPAPVAAPEIAAPVLVATAPTTVGIASWYKTGRGLHRTCSGQMLNNNALTAASPVLPMGTTVRVTSLDSGATVLLRVNDRMPREHRVLDVTELAARELGLFGNGVARVSVTPVAAAVMLAEN